jgi:YHS domain-containing protein
MKNYIIILLAFTLITSCKQVTTQNETMYDEANIHKDCFKDVNFANSIDFICDMKLSSGISDTAHYHGKIYGFCSKACKEEFVSNPKKYEVVLNY